MGTFHRQRVLERISAGIQTHPRENRRQGQVHLVVRSDERPRSWPESLKDD